MQTLQVFVAICALSFASSVPFREECDFGVEVFNCMAKVRMNDSKGYPHFMNEDELNTMCRKLMPFADCVAEVAGWCDDKEKRDYMDLYVIQHKILKPLCDNDSDLRKDYLKQGICLNGIKDQLSNECYEGVSILIDRRAGKETCQYYKNTVDKCEKTILSGCGNDAVDMIRRLVKPQHDQYEKYCGNVLH